jgi:DNA-binding SARP family transcriptional activator
MIQPNPSMPFAAEPATSPQRQGRMHEASAPAPAVTAVHKPRHLVRVALPAAVSPAPSGNGDSLSALVHQAYQQLRAGQASAAEGTLASVLALTRTASLREEETAPAARPFSAPDRFGPEASSKLEHRIVVHTLGRFEVGVDGSPLATSRKQPKRTLSLLKALIALGGQRVCRSALIDALWPDIDGDMAQNALEVTLHRLRARLGVPEAIAARNGCLQLDAKLVWVDALAFGACGEEPPCAGRASMHVEAALELYRGTFLPDDTDACWSLRMRERLRARFVRIVAEAAARLEAVSQFEAAATLYERALAVDDLACVFHDGLARCLQQLGRASEAYMARERGSHLHAVAGSALAGAA